MTRGAKRALAGLTVIAGAGAIAWWVISPRTIRTDGFWATLFGPGSGRTLGKRKGPGFKLTTTEPGSVLCPQDVGKLPANTSSLSKGDFIIIELISADKKFVEPTWAQVLSISPDSDHLYVQITGELTNQGLRPIETDKHKFFLGQKIVIDRSCVFDVLHAASTFTGQVVCGPGFLALKDSSGDPLFSPVDTSAVKNGDFVQVIVASPEAQGTAWHESVWVILTEVSPTKQILKGIVSEDPSLTPQHGLVKYSELEFTRDCVIGVTDPYASDFDPLNPLKYLFPPIFW